MIVSEVICTGEIQDGGVGISNNSKYRITEYVITAIYNQCTGLNPHEQKKERRYFSCYPSNIFLYNIDLDKFQTRFIFQFLRTFRPDFVHLKKDTRLEGVYKW